MGGDAESADSTAAAAQGSVVGGDSIAYRCTGRALLYMPPDRHCSVLVVLLLLLKPLVQANRNRLSTQ